MSKLFFSFGSVLAFFAVAAGALGGHVLKSRLSDYHLEIFEIASRYHMYHAVAVIICSWATKNCSSPLAKLAGWLFIMGIVILISGPQYAWAFLTYSFVQSVLGIIFGFRILSSEWAQVEGVKMTNEFWIAPLVFTVLYGFLLFNMQEILYVTEVAS